MPEYIDKLSVVNRLIDLENEFQQYKPFNGFEHAMYRKLCEAEIAIGKTPAADVATVRHGYWRPILHKDGKTDYECSCCLGIIMDVPDDDEHDLYAWCSMCGAKMDLK